MKSFIKVILILALASSLLAQQPAKGSADQPAKKDSVENREPAATENFYKLAFVVYELDDGKRTNQRDYMMVGKTNRQPSSIRIATRVPVFTQDKQMQYVDAGLTLRCTMTEQADRRLQTECDIEISNFVRSDHDGPAIPAAGNSAPIMRTTRTSSWALLTMGKPTVFTTVDDVNSAKRMQIEVTATKLD